MDGLFLSLSLSTWMVTCAVSSLSAWQPEPRDSPRNDTYSEIYRSPRREPETFHVSFAPPPLLLSNDGNVRSAAAAATGPAGFVPAV